MPDENKRPFHSPEYGVGVSRRLIKHCMEHRNVHNQPIQFLKRPSFKSCSVRNPYDSDCARSDSVIVCYTNEIENLVEEKLMLVIVT